MITIIAYSHYSWAGGPPKVCAVCPVHNARRVTLEKGYGPVLGPIPERLHTVQGLRNWQVDKTPCKSHIS